MSMMRSLNTRPRNAVVEGSVIRPSTTVERRYLERVDYERALEAYRLQEDLMRAHPPKDGNVKWIVGGCVAALFMVLTFGSWAIQHILDMSERNAIRAHEINKEVLAVAKSAHANQGGFDPGMALICAMILLGMYAVFKGISKVK